MDADQVGLGDHFTIIGAAAAHPAVGHADNRKPMCLRLGDRGAGSMIHRQHADIVPAIVEDRDIGLAHHAHRSTLPPEAAVLRNIEDFSQPRIFIPAQRGIDHMVGQYPSFFSVVADASKCAFRMFAGFGDAQMNTIVCHLSRSNYLTIEFCSTRKTALPAIRRSRNWGPIVARSRQLLSTSAGFSEPSAISDASKARSGANRSSGSEVK